MFACFSPGSVGQLCKQYDLYNIKQLHHLLKTTRIFAWSRLFAKARFCVGAIRSFIFDFFAIQNFSRDRKAVLLRKWIALILQVKFRFMVCLVKANALASGNIASSLSSQLSLAQMKYKMVLSCLKLKQNSFKPLKQSMFTFTTKAF